MVVEAAAVDRIPSDSIDSFAGVGHIWPTCGPVNASSIWERVRLDSFIAALHVGPTGAVFGVDDAQLAKATRLADARGLRTVSFRKGYIEETGLPDGSVIASSRTVSSISPPTRRGCFRKPPAFSNP